MNNKELQQFKYNFLNLRWLIVIAAAVMALSSIKDPVYEQNSFINSLVIFFIGSNVLLYYVSLDTFKKSSFRYIIFIADILLVSLGIYFTKNTSTDFFLLYFLVIVITALGKDLKASIVATIVASLIYFWIIVKKDGADVNLYDVNVYMRIPFLFVVGLFTGFLSETVKKEETHVKDLRLILTITEIMNENIDHDIMVDLLDPLFEKMDTITDWEIAILDEESKKFKFLRENTFLGANEMDPDIVDTLINKAEIYKGKNYIYFPQAREKKVTGFFRIKPKDFGHFSEQDYDLFQTLAGEFALVIERNRLYDEIRNLADKDRLTDLYNYGYFLVETDKRVTLKKEFAVIMIDLDNFKTYNDTYGHILGNNYLRSIADGFKAELKNCLLARYGGDEFVFLREGKNEDILKFMKEFKAKMDERFLAYEKKIKVTMSIGYALFPKDGKTAEEVLTAADRGLYKAKQTGKNRIAYL